MRRGRLIIKIYLGLSLATLLSNPGVNDLIIDVWEGGSVLYGWDFLNSCLDRLPLLVEDSDCVKRLGGRPVEFDIMTELLGMEKDIIRKLQLNDLSRFWPFKLSKNAYLPANGWCTLFRKKISKVQSKRIFGEIKYIDPQEKELRVSWWRKLNYNTLYNTLPLDYLMKKLRDLDSVKNGLKSIPLYISSLLIRSRLDEFRIYYLGKKKYASVTVIHSPLLNPKLSGYSIAYMLIPYQAFRDQGAFRERAISDAKKLGLLEGEPVFIRGYFEKYGVLLGGVSELAHFRNYGIILLGRLGKWKELGICDILNEMKEN